MILFWAVVRENDVENYAKTLVLPNYMSHLSMEPFRFDDQTRNTTGREPLVVRYSSDGRLEEYPLDPLKHAKRLVAAVAVRIDPDKLAISSDDAIWNWGNGDCASEVSSLETIDSDSEVVAERFMRIYIEPVVGELGRETETPFPPKDAYVSVSRRELFLSNDVVFQYLLNCCRSFEFDDDSLESPKEKTNDERRFQASDLLSARRGARVRCPDVSDARFSGSVADVFSETDETLPFETELANGEFRFRYGNIAGEFLVSEGKSFDDLILFAGLNRSLGYVEDFVKADLSRATPELTADGVRLKLFDVE